MICFFCGNSINTSVCPFCNKEQPVLSGGDGYFNIVKELNGVKAASDEPVKIAAASMQQSSAVSNEQGGTDVLNKKIADLNNKNQNQQNQINAQDKKIKKLEEDNKKYSKISMILLIIAVVALLLFLVYVIWSRISISHMNDEINTLAPYATKAAEDEERRNVMPTPVGERVEDRFDDEIEMMTEATPSPELENVEGGDGAIAETANELTAEATKAAEETEAAKATEEAKDKEKSESKEKNKSKDNTKDKNNENANNAGNGDSQGQPEQTPPADQSADSGQTPESPAEGTPAEGGQE